MSVFDLKAGESAKILSIDISGNALARLQSLGIAVGKRVTVLSFSLFKTGVLIGCGAVRVGVRRELAKLIGVEKCA
ncbi:MAG: ferrous iron transport protein A [Clostridia bacterium]|nr:ferrous iron transport protein A [Clostridia bacterium]